VSWAPSSQNTPATMAHSSEEEEEEDHGGGRLLSPTAEHAAVRALVRSFARDDLEPQSRRHDAQETPNTALLRKLGKELGMLGPTIPAESVPGGGGLDAVAAVIIAEELSYADPGFALSHLAHATLFAHNLYVNGSQEQRLRYLPGALDGSTIGGMGMTEPTAGTDVLGMRTRATRDGAYWVLDGHKAWITNAYVVDDDQEEEEERLGDVFLVYARTGAARDAISLFVVERGFKGFSLGRAVKGKLGMRASATGDLIFEACRVPAENLVGAVDQGTTAMMRNLEIERLALAAMATGIARRCLDVMRVYARERRAFGTDLASFGQIQAHIADSFGEYNAARAYLYAVARHAVDDDNGTVNRRLDSDAVKLVATRAAKQVADRAIQTLGANGYVADYVVERLWRDAKLLEIGGGTLESHQKNITRDLVRFHHDDADLPETW